MDLNTHPVSRESPSTTPIATPPPRTPAPAEPTMSSDDLTRRMLAYWHDPADFDVVRRAWNIAQEAHKHQVRKSGEPYFTHPVQVAHILADLKLDPTSIAAALLHDVVEDTPVSIEEIYAQFGQDIAHIVDGVTKLSKLEDQSLEDAQANTYRKMFIAMANDPRVVLIKLADRLHNMRTLSSMKPEKQLKIASETLDVYAPLAHRLGIWQFKWELEDTAFRYLHPDKYQEISNQLAMRREARERMVQRVILRLKQVLERENIRADITGRPKHIYSIHRKMERKKVSLAQIYDQLAVRVIVSTTDECYRVLGLVHAGWTPVIAEFDDYIAVPKNSMYRSLHTTIVIPGEHPCEVQIRTHEMHEVAEHGIAAHWRYKEGFGRRDQSFEAKLKWLRSSIEGQQELEGVAFFNSVKDEVLQDQVFVLTPKGKIIELPKGSTPVDFAYRIHSEVGHRCTGARVNNKSVPLHYQLQHGEIVEILTSKQTRGPSRDWLEYVRSPSARTHIRRWFRRQERDVNISTGRDVLERQFKRMGVREPLDQIAKANNFRTVDDMLAAIGNGDYSPKQALEKVIRQHSVDEDPLAAIPTVAPPSKPTKPGISVRGEKGLLLRMARCCNPVYPESIIGFVTRGKGISIHRTDCYSVLNERNKERLIEVDWGMADQKQCYPVPILIDAWDRVGLWRDIADAIADEGISIQTLSQLANKHYNRATLLVMIRIESITQLHHILDKLNRIKDVVDARRENTAFDKA